MSVLRWLRIFIPLLLVAVLVAGTVLVLSSRSELNKSRGRVDRAWSALHPALHDRYEALHVANEAVKDIPGPLHRIVLEVDGDYSHWHDLEVHDASSLSAEVEAANDLESVGRRLVVAARAAPRLTDNQPALGAVDAFAKLGLPETATAFDDAVSKFEQLRGKPSYTLAARVLGYDAIPSFDTTA